MSDKLVLKFDPNTIQHLGISLYSKLPSVLSELISNSWDADAENVTIEFKDVEGEKEIVYSDDGEGMTFEELNEKYLVIGRNRRIDTKRQTTAKGREVIGKKGLGKLAVFGICNVIEVISIKNGKKNHFIMNLNDIKASTSNEYTPEIRVYNQEVSEPAGTILKLLEVRRKSPFKLEDIAKSLSKSFLIFDDLTVGLLLNGSQTKYVTKELKLDGLESQFTWEFPSDQYGKEYEYWQEVKGTIMTLSKPIKDTEMIGVYLTSRGKTVNTASFYGLRDTDLFHTYATGYLKVDFIDKFEEDVISTDRQSLNWENDETKKLQEYLQKVIKKVGSQWKKQRKELKKETVKAEKLVDITEWQEGLPEYERKLSDQIFDPILESPDMDIDDSVQIITGVMDKFDNKDYKMYASAIAETAESQNIPKFVQLIDDWKILEAKQFKDLSYSRVEVIKQFEYYIDTDTKEVPTLHNFFKKFSWLLDPRILEFRDEVTYSKLLKDKFPDKDLEERNRRIDFLCSNALGEILHVIEIKRSNYKIDEKAIEQAYRYGSFLRNHYASASGFSQVVCYVVGGEKSKESDFTSKEKTYSKTGEVFVKTYRELLEQSKEYHKEFISAYEDNQK